MLHAFQNTDMHSHSADVDSHLFQVHLWNWHLSVTCHVLHVCQTLHKAKVRGTQLALTASVSCGSPHEMFDLSPLGSSISVSIHETPREHSETISAQFKRNIGITSVISNSKQLHCCWCGSRWPCRRDLVASIFRCCTICRFQSSLRLLWKINNGGK